MNYKKLARKANDRLRALEKADRDFWAYDKATLFTQRAYGTKRFKTSDRGMTEEGRKRAIEEIQNFLKSKSSTVRGSREIDKKIIKKFRTKKHGFTISNEREFFNFLSSENYRNLVNKNISSEMLIDFYDRATEDGVAYSDIEEALKDFREGEIEGVEDLFNEFGMSVFDEKD